MDNALFAAPIVRSIGWALIHFVWQGALIGAATALALRSLAGARATSRYAVACGGLVVMLATPLLTVLSGDGATSSSFAVAGPARSAGATQVSTAAPGAPSALPPDTGARDGTSIESMLPMAVFAWMTGVCLLSLRLAAGCLGVTRLRRRATRAVAGAVADRVADLSRRLDIVRPVRVLESAAVAVPAVIGCLRPVILLPATVLTGLPAAQLDAVIAHELAHIRRHDYLVNALQSFAEALLFFHPAVWWCSRQVRIEREHCCDDIVVMACGDRLAYATALASLEELRRPRMAFALGATDGPLVNRVRRLLSSTPDGPRRAPAWVVVTGLTCVLAVVLAGPMFSSADLRDGASGRVVRADVAESQRPSAPLTLPAPQTPPTPSTPLLRGPVLLSYRDVAMQWRDGSARVVLTNGGTIALADDDRDIVEMAPDGEVTFQEGGWVLRWLGMGRRLTLRGRFDGTIERRYIVNGRERPYDPEGHRWLGEILPRLARNLGLGADARVARILEREGVAGIAREMSRVDSDWVRRRYVTLVAEQGTLTPSALGELLLAVRQIGSDYELAEALITLVDRQPIADVVVHEYFSAVDAIGSDYEHRRVLSSVVESPSPSLAVLEGVLQSASRMGSDYERATLLVGFAERHPVTGPLRDAYLAAVGSIGSDYERGRAMEPVVRQLQPGAPVSRAGEPTPDDLDRLAADVARLEQQLSAQAQSSDTLARLAQLRAELAVATANIAAARQQIRGVDGELVRMQLLQTELAARAQALNALDATRPEIEELRKGIEAAGRALSQLRTTPR